MQIKMIFDLKLLIMFVNSFSQRLDMKYMYTVHAVNSKNWNVLKEITKTQIRQDTNVYFS